MLNSIVLVILFTFLLSFICTRYYRSFAIKKDIVANPNIRSLHEQQIPRGGGVVFSIIFVVAVFVLGLLNIFKFEFLMVIGVGGFVASMFGFFDDVVDIRALLKLFIQSILAGWILFWFDGGVLTTVDWLPVWLSWFVSWFLLVWMMNLYNFMDGVDGMAASGAIFVTVALVVVLLMSGVFSSLVLLFSLLALRLGGFCSWNFQL